MLDNDRLALCASLLVSVDGFLVSDFAQHVEAAKHLAQIPSFVIVKLSDNLSDLFPMPDYNALINGLDVERFKPLGFMTKFPTNNYLVCRIQGILNEVNRHEEFERLEGALGTLWKADDFMQDDEDQSKTTNFGNQDAVRIPLATLLAPKVRQHARNHLSSTIQMKKEAQQVGKPVYSPMDKPTLAEVENQSSSSTTKIWRPNQTEKVDLFNIHPRDFIKFFQQLPTRFTAKNDQANVKVDQTLNDIDGVQTASKDMIKRG